MCPSLLIHQVAHLLYRYMMETPLNQTAWQSGSARSCLSPTRTCFIAGRHFSVSQRISAVIADLPLSWVSATAIGTIVTILLHILSAAATAFIECEYGQQIYFWSALSLKVSLMVIPPSASFNTTQAFSSAKPTASFVRGKSFRHKDTASDRNLPFCSIALFRGKQGLMSLLCWQACALNAGYAACSLHKCALTPALGPCIAAGNVQPVVQ